MHRQSEHASQATNDVDHCDNLERPQQHNISRSSRPGTGVPLTVLVVDRCNGGSFPYGWPDLLNTHFSAGTTQLARCSSLGDAL